MGAPARFDDRFRKRIWRIVGASLVMGVVLVLTDAMLETVLNTPWWRGLGLMVLIAIGAIAFFVAAQMFGAVKFSEFRNALRRGG